MSLIINELIISSNEVLKKISSGTTQAKKSISMVVTHQLPLPIIEQKALQIRRQIIKMLAHAGSGHPAGALGMADVFAALYFHILNVDPKNPEWEERDRLILSNGHICPVLYATLAEAGYFPKEELLTLRQIHSRLQGHPHRHSIAGVENTSGPLGQGLSLAAGWALGLKMNHNQSRVFCITSDGEHQEGQTWEAYQFAYKYQLNNLVNIVDRNQIQISDFTKHVMPLEPLKAKIESFGWQTIEVDGHDITQIIAACETARFAQALPTALICHTVPGKGVSFMENKPEWHGKPPNEEQAARALKELSDE